MSHSRFQTARKLLIFWTFFIGLGAVAGAARTTGHVCAPSLQQRVVGLCAAQRPDLEAYDRNRKDLYEGLTEMGYRCVRPQGAFYLFVKSPVEDEAAFCAKAKEEHILIVPGSSFACPGYVRIAYCVSHEQIERSLPAFREIAREYGLLK